MMDVIDVLLPFLNALIWFHVGFRLGRKRALSEQSAAFDRTSGETLESR